MKNQSREAFKSLKVIKEKDTQILDLKNQISQLTKDVEVLKLYEPLKTENNKLKRELQDITKELNETKTTLEHRLTEKIDSGTYIESQNRKTFCFRPKSIFTSTARFYCYQYFT